MNPKYCANRALIVFYKFFKKEFNWSLVHLYSHFPMIQILASFPSGSSCKSKCGLEGTRRIVGGENSTVSIICYCYCYCGGRRFYGFYHSVFNWQCQIGTCLRGTFISDFWKNLGFCPNQVDPPPLPESWDIQN